MKKTAVFLIILSVLLSVSSCSVKSPEYAVYGKYTVTQGMYSYWLGYYKAAFYASFSEYGLTGEEYDETVWEQKINSDQTLGQQVIEHVNGLIKEMLVCAYLYDEMKLYLDSDIKQAVEQTVSENIAADIKAVGSRSEYNKILARYGCNADTMKQIYAYEVKAAAVENKLFGEGGKYEITDSDREEYYQKNYVRIKHVLINNSIKYVLDDNGDPIMNIYTGTYETEPLTEEEKLEKKTLAESVKKAAEAGSDFDGLILQYNEDSGMSTYTDGYFITSSDMLDTSYLSAVLSLGVGEAALVESSYGLTVIKKYELIPYEWKNETYAAAFFNNIDTVVTDEKKLEVYSEYYKDISVAADFTATDIPVLDSRLLSSYS